MPTEMVRVIARITARPEHADELKAVLLRIVQPTRAERGCVRYELHQSETDAADFVFIEEWTDGAAIAAHMQAKHVRDALQKAAALVAAPPDIRRYHLIA